MKARTVCPGEAGLPGFYLPCTALCSQPCHKPSFTRSMSIPDPSVNFPFLENINPYHCSMEPYPSVEAFNSFQVQLFEQLDEQLKVTWNECLNGNISMPRTSAQDNSRCIARSAGKSTSTRWVQHGIDCVILAGEGIAGLTHNDHDQVSSPEKQSIQ